MAQRASGTGEVLLRLENVVKHFPIGHRIFPGPDADAIDRPDQETADGDLPGLARSSP
jgi:hypothetical protein